MTEIDTLFRNARLADGRTVDVAVKDGRLARISRPMEISLSSKAAVDLDGRLVLPGFVDGHIHLDKAFVGDGWRSHRPCIAGFDVRERVAIEKQELSRAAPVAERGTALIELCVAQGTLHMRSHVDIDPTRGLAGFEAVAQLREANRDVVTIQIVAFPQSGILTAPGTRDLLDAAIRDGADLVGGLDPASFDGDMDGHLDAVFDLAERHGVGVDIHLHDGDLLGIFQIEEIARRTRALGMDGKVTISHAYALGQVSEGVASRAADRLAEAGVSILTNAPGAHAFPPVLLLRRAGVNVFAGNDNIRDAWWPYGDGDLLERAMIVGYRSGFYTDDELAVAFDMITRSAATALGVENYGLVEGGAADFVVVEAAHVQHAVVARPRSRDIYKAGRLIARDGKLMPRGAR